MIYLLICFLLSPQGHTQTSSQSFFSSQAFESIPILDEGRYKPMISFAQSTLLKISGTKRWKKKTAIEFMCQLLFEPENLINEQLFLIKDKDILRSLGLPPIKNQKRYSFSFFSDHIEHIQKVVQTILDIAPSQRTIREKQILQLWSSIQLFIHLSFSLQHLNPMPFFTIKDPQLLNQIQAKSPIYTYQEIRPFIPKIKDLAKKVHTKSTQNWSENENKIMTSLFQYTQWTQQQKNHILLICHKKGHSLSPWQKMAQNTTYQPSLELLTLQHIQLAYQQQNQKEFNKACHSFYLNAIQKIQSIKKRRFQVEIFYHHFQPFRLTQHIFLCLIFISIGLFISFKFGKNILTITFLILSSLTVLIYTSGIIGRIFILARPPVSTLYETFLFVGWVISFFSFFIIVKRRTPDLFLAWSGTGLILQTIAHYYGLEGDTFKTVEAVLNNNFWLATHVLAVTTGYAGCFFAGILGHIYTIKEYCQPQKKQDFLFKLTTATLFIGWFFVSLGTLLGGVWADQSWGRFWGWDPKENGALMIILTTAIIFHLYWDQTYQKRGFALGTIVVLMSVLIAWFGTNLLGVGLHSYGFTSGTAIKLGLTLLFEIFFIFIFAFIHKKNPQKKYV